MVAVAVDHAVVNIVRVEREIVAGVVERVVAEIADLVIDEDGFVGRDRDAVARPLDPGVGERHAICRRRSAAAGARGACGVEAAARVRQPLRLRPGVHDRRGDAGPDRHVVEHDVVRRIRKAPGVYVDQVRSRGDASGRGLHLDPGETPHAGVGEHHRTEDRSRAGRGRDGHKVRGDRSLAGIWHGMTGPEIVSGDVGKFSRARANIESAVIAARENNLVAGLNWAFCIQRVRTGRIGGEPLAGNNLITPRRRRWICRSVNRVVVRSRREQREGVAGDERGQRLKAAPRMIGVALISSRGGSAARRNPHRNARGRPRSGGLAIGRIDIPHVVEGGRRLDAAGIDLLRQGGGQADEYKSRQGNDEGNYFHFSSPWCCPDGMIRGVKSQGGGVQPCGVGGLTCARGGWCCT